MELELLRQRQDAQSLRHMSPLTSIETAYASPPHQGTRKSASPDPADVERQLVAGMSALQSHDGGSHRAYQPSQTQLSMWSACIGTRLGSEEFDNYSFHSSPTLSSLQHEAASGPSSPRSWATSPERYTPSAWEPVPDYPKLDPQLSGYPLGNGNIPTSFPADGLPFVPSQSLGVLGSGYQRRSQTEPYPTRYHGPPSDASPPTPDSSYPLSPCSSTLGLGPDEGMASPLGEEAEDSASIGASKECGVEGRRSTSAPAATGNNKGEESYAKLIHRAFMSSPRHSMTLQEIYQWFRDNTNKGKDDSKGWQNSIRHNLSMNMVCNSSNSAAILPCSTN